MTNREIENALKLVHQDVKTVRDRQNTFEKLLHELADALGIVTIYNPTLKRFTFRLRRGHTLEQIRNEVSHSFDEDKLRPGKPVINRNASEQVPRQEDDV